MSATEERGPGPQPSDSDSGSSEGAPPGRGAAPAGAPAALPEIPGYRIHGVLGRGSTGVVYRATQLAVDRAVALKVLHPGVARGRVVRRLQREARTTARLSHPNIVTAIDMGSCDGIWWYAMELVEGPSLASRLRREERLSERAALRLFIPLCEALVHLDQHGVVHRDIKPANILVDQNGRARLVDLGLAFAEDDPAMTVQGSTLGTPHYVSPEQARNAQEADVRSDIWSLGATLYHTVTGRPPFAGSNVADIISAVLYARVPDPGELAPELSRGLCLILRKCLSRAPERRYQTPEELLEDLERLRERRQVHVQRGELEPVAGQEERRRRLALAALSAGGAGLLALVWALAPGDWFGGRGGDSSEVESEAPHAELEALAARPVDDRTALASTLAALDELRDELPPAFEDRWREVRAGLKRRYTDAVDQLRSGFHRDLSQALERRDFVAAQALVGGGLERRLESELAPTPSQLAELRALFELDARRAELEAALDAALQSVDRRLRDHLERKVLPAAAAKRDQNRWVSAQNALRVSVAARLGEADIDVSGLQPARVAVIVETVRVELAEPALSALEAAWVRLDEELALWIEERADELRAGLEHRSTSGAADLLAQAWAEERQALGLEADELLTEFSDRAGEALESRLRELVVLEEQLIQEDAGRILTERVERVAPLWARRDYAELIAIWGAALELPYMEPERQRLRSLLLEAELLEGLLGRAAAGLTELAESGRPALFVIGSIGVEGTLIPGPDLLDAPFALRPLGAAGNAQDMRLGLRVLPGSQPLTTADVERLAALSDAEGGAADPRERLVRALFRWREGDLAAAAGLLPLPALSDPALDLLAWDLLRRVGRSLEERDSDREQRLEQARGIERLINRVVGDRSVHPADVVETVGRIDRLLTEFADLEYVRRREPELRFLKQRLSLPEPALAAADFEDTFGASTVSIDPGARRVRLGFVFDESTFRGPWSHGDWVVAGNGWEAPGVSSREQLLNEPRWPRLVLRSPLDLEQPLSVEFELLQPRGSGPPQLLVVSVAGVHVALSGNAQGGGARLLIASGGTQEFGKLLADALDAKRGAPTPGLVRGEPHRLRVALTRGRGRAEVYLDGLLIGQEDRPRPYGEPGSASVVLRSIEAVRLVSAEISAGFRGR